MRDGSKAKNLQPAQLATEEQTGNNDDPTKKKQCGSEIKPVRDYNNNKHGNMEIK